VRVIAGEFRSRRLLSLPGLETRPTPDRLRETLFSILLNQIEGSVFVDAYAGTGAVGIEALSRGARHVVFIESNRQAVEVIRQNLESLKATGRARVVKGFAAACKKDMEGADIVFADPPYTKEREYEVFLEALSEVTPPLSIIQHSVRFNLGEHYGPISRTRVLKQGENALSFYSVNDQSSRAELPESSAD